MAGRKKLDDTPTLPWRADPDAQWVQEADYYSKNSSCSEDEARDLVILRYLHAAGDTRPLVSWIMTGRAPGPAVQRYLAQMFEPNEADLDKLPYEFGRKRRNGARGKHPDPALNWRDRLVATIVEKNMSGKKARPYERAIAETVTQLPEFGLELSADAVRKAYDDRHKRK
jgi:hypothetical protein